MISGCKQSIIMRSFSIVGRSHHRFCNNFQLQLPVYVDGQSRGKMILPSLEVLMSPSPGTHHKQLYAGFCFGSFGSYWHSLDFKCLLSRVSGTLKMPRGISFGRPNSTLGDAACTSKIKPFRKQFTVEIGSTLKINLLGTNAQVHVLEGGNYEAISIEADWSDGRTAENWVLLDISSSNSLISLTRKCEKRYSNGVFLLEALRATIPGRWCSLDLEVGRRPVHVENLNEANIRVKTTGGDVKIGRSRGSIACIESNGGYFEAIAVSATTEVKTCGGGISIEKIVGKTIKLDSGGGNVNLGSLYGDDAMLISAGGTVNVRHMQVSSCNISTCGGAVSINGLGGNLKVLSSGGNVIIQLHDDATQVEINSGQGDVIILISAQLAAKVKHLGSGSLSLEGPISKIEILPGIFKIKGVTNGEFSAICEITVYGSGNILFKQRSWLESVTKRWENIV